MIKKIAITTILASTFLFGAQTVVETEKNNNDTKITKTTVVTGSHTTLPGSGANNGEEGVKATKKALMMLCRQ